MAYGLTDLRTITRHSAKNAMDPTVYSDTAVDYALQQAMHEWNHGVKENRHLDTVTLTANSASVGTMPTGLTPDLILQVSLTLSGSLITPDLQVVRYEDLLQARYEGRWGTGGSATTANTGQPKILATKDGTNWEVFPTPDLAYVLNIWWARPQTTWTPGGTCSSFDVSDDSLRIIAALGAPYYLQRMEPENLVAAEASGKAFRDEITQHRGLGVGSKGPQVLMRKKLAWE